MQQREETSFLPKDPYHTPGYGGFCPQFKYQIGQTFGRTTRRLLQDEEVPTSGRLVLSEIRRPIDQDNQEEMKKADLFRSRGRSLGDQKLTEKMVPGYTGFIPKSQHYFGNRYAVNCRNSIADFEFDHQKHDQKLRELKVIGDVQTGKLLPSPELPPIKSRYVTPLKRVTIEPVSARVPGTARSVQAPVSPYQLPNEDPMKNFMSGYTGFVPRSRGIIGMSYPIITHEALNTFSNETYRSKMLSQQPVNLHQEEQKIVNMKQIYPKETGLVPHYTGHIPGQKFRYGNTFGHGTEDALHHALTQSS
ncbi:hypothetical protein LOTGIDRAFT_237357 [Lottia gigantea]|uniref:Ciliary microtubule inner protein 2A-C-like domain-containing protein n=1 Tax=Lottia gigantea TaxID=225164 RepID=V4BAK4_LOTGI|nr:hypothetical protein LOTGIDRAFT_237357 [Lottia gigantea]ESP04526.1 hypothetical protein LOTGIDRAFT_237357 [Lottia gigantea]